MTNRTKAATTPAPAGEASSSARGDTAKPARTQQAPAKKATARKAVPTKAPAKKTTGTKAPAKKTTATKATQTKATPTKAAAQRTSAPATGPAPEAAPGTRSAGKAGPGRAFAAGRDAWLSRLDTLRQQVRHDVVRRQLEVHMPLEPATVLDVGAGQGTLAIALARQGYDVTAVEPDAAMRTALDAALTAESEDVRSRVRVLDEELDTLDEVFGIQDVFDVVICHGVLMYLPDPNPAIRVLGRRLADDGILSVVARNAGSLALRHAARGEYDRANALLDEVDTARWEQRDPMYTNGIGVQARADTVERLGAFFGGSRVGVEAWYGVRCYTDGLPDDAPVPTDPAELQQILDLEYRFGRTEPYKRAGSLVHVIGRRGAGRGPQITW